MTLALKIVAWVIITVGSFVSGCFPSWWGYTQKDAEETATSTRVISSIFFGLLGALLGGVVLFPDFVLSLLGYR